MIDATFLCWRPRLLRFCAQLLRNGHDAEEVVQDIFARLVQKAADFDLREDPGVLLFRLARNRCIDVRRKKAVPVRADIEATARREGPDRDLDEALASLPEAEREALLLTTVDGLGYREVAAILHCSLGTVAALRYAAIDKMRQRLRP